MSGRTLIWWSTGAASFVAAQIELRDNPDALIVRCETNNEDPDNYRFEADAMQRLNRQPTLLQSAKYESVWDVWQKRRYMNGIDGAPCTLEMKVVPRLEFQRPTDIHVFGYTADARARKLDIILAKAGTNDTFANQQAIKRLLHLRPDLAGVVHIDAVEDRACLGHRGCRLCRRNNIRVCLDDGANAADRNRQAEGRRTMKNSAPGAGVRWFVCDEGHVHMTFVDEDDSDIVSISIDIEDWVDLADAIDEEIDTMIAVEESEGAVKH